MKVTQNERIIEYLKTFGSITQLEATQELGVLRLPSRIFDLRSKGYNITSERVLVTNRFGEKGYVKRYSIREDL